MEIKSGLTAAIAVKQKPIAINAEKKEKSALAYEKVRLRKATREFESFFMASMLKSMRATVPKSSDDSEVPGGGLGKDMYQDMFDTELAKKMAERSNGGIGDVLYKALVSRVEAEYREKPQGLSLSETLSKSQSVKLTPDTHLDKSKDGE